MKKKFGLVRHMYIIYVWILKKKTSSILYLTFQDNPLVNVKKLNCALLPPCRKSLMMKLRRTNFITIMWTSATEANPIAGLSATDYGWSLEGQMLKPQWFEGQQFQATCLMKWIKQE